MPRQPIGTDFTKKKIVVVGGAKISGSDYQVIKDALDDIWDDENDRAMNVSQYLSSFLKSLAADIRAGRRIKKY